jgi:hypothetical protein
VGGEFGERSLGSGLVATPALRGWLRYTPLIGMSVRVGKRWDRLRVSELWRKFIYEFGEVGGFSLSIVVPLLLPLLCVLPDDHNNSHNSYTKQTIFTMKYQASAFISVYVCFV